MELKVIIWIIIGIIYIVSRARKKTPPTPHESGPAETETFDKPVSFEDLLREIQAAKQPKPQPVLKPLTKVESLDRNVEKDDRSLEKTKPDTYYRDEDKIYETYENAKR